MCAIVLLKQSSTHVYEDQTIRNGLETFAERVILHIYVTEYSTATRETRHEFCRRMDIAIQRAYADLEANQEFYKRNFDKRVR